MGSEPTGSEPAGSEPIACPWCVGQMKPAAQGRYKADPEDGPDAWAACLVCLSCAAASPWGKGDTQAEAVASAEYRARDLLRRMAAARPAEGGA